MQAPAVFSAHYLVAEYTGIEDNEAHFKTRKYLRYAKPDQERGLMPQHEWSTPIGAAVDAQTASMADEVEGELSAVIAGLVAGDLVELEWLQILQQDGEQVRACQKLEKFEGDLDEEPGEPASCQPCQPAASQ